MKKILVIWPSHREDWILPFKQLKEDFEFVFLSGIAPNVYQPNFVEEFATCIYWKDFQSAQELLEKVKPEKLVFMSIDTGLNIVLNKVAKDQGIATYILQHGIYTNYRDYRIREKLWKKRQIAKNRQLLKSNHQFNTLQFVRNSLKGIDSFKLLIYAIYAKASQKIGPYWAAKHLSFEDKRAVFYLCFSPYNATIHRETDGVGEDRIRYIGSPELQAYLIKEEDLIQENFYLHIDQALAENSFGEETVSKEKMIQFYLKLNDFCLSQRARLYIKLHPESYQTEWLPQDKNIVYLKKVDNFNRYIQSAQGCFGFYSTMVIPAVYWKPTILFRVFYSGLQEAILSQNKSQKILEFESFNAANIEFESDSKMINIEFFSKLDFKLFKLFNE